MLRTLIAGRKWRKSSFLTLPFIYLIVPFIRNNKACKLPYIGNRLPIVGKTRLGFTLIELVVTLAVVAVVTVFAVPAMRSIIQTQRITTAANDLISDVHVARSEALRRTTPIGLCSSSSGNACDGGGGWQNGRIIFVDENNNQLFDANEEIIRSRAALVHNTLTVPGLPGPLIFNSRGLVINLPVAGASFNLCDDRGFSYGRTILVTPTGQASSGAATAC